jgi:hypothetical protein
MCSCVLACSSPLTNYINSSINSSINHQLNRIGVIAIDEELAMQEMEELSGQAQSIGMDSDLDSDDESGSDVSDSEEST